MGEDNLDQQVRSYGMPRDLFATMKHFGVSIFSILVVVLAGLIPLFLGYGEGKFFPKHQLVQFILFFIFLEALAIFMVLPFNGGKTNAHAIWIFMTKRRRKFLSFDRPIQSQLEEKEEKSIIRRRVPVGVGGRNGR